MEKTYTITHNEHFDSLEVSFSAMPAAEVRTALKTMGFRWHSVKKLWYGHAEESAVLAAIDPQPLTLPDPAELKAWISRQKEAWKSSHNGSTKSMPDLHYDFGTDKPAVNAAFLLDMLEALPGCQAEFTGTLTAIHFTAETGIGLLMPVRPAKERKETDLAA